MTLTDAEPATEPDARRRFAVASALGGVPAFVVFVWMLTQGRANVTQREVFGNFFDAQAKALLHGHWDVPAQELYIEGFKLGSKTYTYFGLWPTVLRMPVLVFGDGYYGRLTQLSMLLAVVVAFVGISVLSWRIRSLVRPGRPVTRGELFVTAAVTLTFGCGTAIVFLASRAWVYHEAILWGVAWALLAYERIISFLVAPRVRTLVVASVFAGLGFLSRPAAGLGPIVALALIVLGQLVRWARQQWSDRGHGDSRMARALGRLEWLGARDDNGHRWIVASVVALLVPVGVYVWVNYSRFGSLYSAPWAKQVVAAVYPYHQRALAANGGTYFGLKFAPTSLLQFLRPDGLAFDPVFPFVTFPRYRPPIIGSGVLFDTLDWATSAPATMPALFLLGALGVWAAVVPSYARTRAVAALRTPMIGAATGIVMVVAISVIFNRYLGDWVPFLALAAVTGLHVLLRRREETAHRRGATALLSVAACLAVFGLWVNPAIALVYQRLYNPPEVTARAGMLGFQYDVDGLLGGHPRRVMFTSALPTRPAGAGTTAVVGRCASLSWSDGRVWQPIEGTPAGGWFRFRVEPGAAWSDTWQPVVSWGPVGAEDVVGLRRVAGRYHVGLGLAQGGGGLQWFDTGVPFRASDRGFDLDLHVDEALRSVRATADGTLAAEYPNVKNMAGGPFRVGRASAGDVAPRFDGRLVPRPPSAALCRDLLRRRSD